MNYKAIPNRASRFKDTFTPTFYAILLFDKLRLSNMGNIKLFENIILPLLSVVI